ncbi:hypothetical protein GCM10010365_46630 [Streptomyces poonensis]|uniref:Uncharacterized protein n=1 Tax=Streptomyces poonensis TaxID=68255 RepID=A0A918PSB1_9ACTN|nr:hypothetical protein GCM10010365_46630 [Streptomyces poonensis]
MHHRDGSALTADRARLALGAVVSVEARVRVVSMNSLFDALSIRSFIAGLPTGFRVRHGRTRPPLNGLSAPGIGR